MRFFILCCLLLTSVTVSAREIAGVTVEEALPAADGKLLRLNGAGIRSKFFFDIYIAELYVQQPAGTTKALLEAAGEKKMIMHFLYKEVGRDKLVEGWNEGFAGNSGAEEVAKLQERIDRFNALFVDVKKGESIILDFLPDQGTVVTIAGEKKGVITGKDFNDALLRIWLGPDPVSEGLKEELLGSKK